MEEGPSSSSSAFNMEEGPSSSSSAFNTEEVGNKDPPKLMIAVTNRNTDLPFFEEHIRLMLVVAGFEVKCVNTDDVVNTLREAKSLECMIMLLDDNAAIETLKEIKAQIHGAQIPPYVVFSELYHRLYRDIDSRWQEAEISSPVAMILQSNRNTLRPFQAFFRKIGKDVWRVKGYKSNEEVVNGMGQYGREVKLLIAEASLLGTDGCGEWMDTVKDSRIPLVAVLSREEHENFSADRNPKVQQTSSSNHNKVGLSASKTIKFIHLDASA